MENLMYLFRVTSSYLDTCVYTCSFQGHFKCSELLINFELAHKNVSYR